MCHRHITLTQTLSQMWLPQSALSIEGGNEMSPRDTLKTQSGILTSTWATDTTSQTPTKTTPFVLSTSALIPYSGELPNQSKANIESLVWFQSNTDSESLTKKGKIAAGGDQSMGPPTKKNPWPKHSNLAATKETPPTLTSTSQETNQRNRRNAPLLHWLNSFPHCYASLSVVRLGLV
jgi:hypothetical protein